MVRFNSGSSEKMDSVNVKSPFSVLIWSISIVKADHVNKTVEFKCFGCNLFCDRNTLSIVISYAFLRNRMQPKIFFQQNAFVHVADVGRNIPRTRHGSDWHRRCKKRIIITTIGRSCAHVRCIPRNPYTNFLPFLDRHPFVSTAFSGYVLWRSKL